MAGAQEARTARHDGTTARCPKCHTPSTELATCRRAVVYRLTELLASPPPSDPASTPPPGHARRAGRASHRASRSEERRVGKECRIGWSGYHEKKNRG